MKKLEEKIKPAKIKVQPVINSEEDIIKPIGKQYIDFKRFCELMKLFNPKTPVDAKIRCNFV